MWIRAAEEDVRRNCDGEDCRIFFRVGVHDPGHNCGRKKCRAECMDHYSNVVMHAVHYWRYIYLWR